MGSSASPAIAFLEGLHPLQTCHIVQTRQRNRLFMTSRHPHEPLHFCCRAHHQAFEIGGHNGSAAGPPAGDYAVAFFGVGYGDGAYGGSVPEGFGFGFVVVDGVVGGFYVDAG